MIQQIQTYLQQRKARKDNRKKFLKQMQDRLALEEMYGKLARNTQIVSDLETLAQEYSFKRNPLDSLQGTSPYFIDLDNMHVIYLGFLTQRGQEGAKKTIEGILYTDKTAHFVQASEKNLSLVIDAVETRDNEATLYVLMPSFPLESNQLYKALQELEPNCCSFIEQYASTPQTNDEQ